MLQALASCRDGNKAQLANKITEKEKINGKSLQLKMEETVNWC